MKVIAISVFAVLLIAGCQRQTSPTNSSAARAPIRAKHVVNAPLSVLSVPPQEMRSTLMTAYRLRPDRRLLLSVSDIYQFFTPTEPKGKVQADFIDGKWRIYYRKQLVGDLPELSGFDDWLHLLIPVAQKLNKIHAITLTTDAARDSQADELLQQFKVSDVLSTIRQVNLKWNKNRRDSSGLRTVTSALVVMNLEKLDSMEIADSVAARAVAALVLTKALTGDDVRHEEALLSWSLDHIMHARQVAQELPASDPVRLFITEEDGRLKELAQSENGDSESRYFYLLRLADTGDMKSWILWQKKFFPNLYSLPVLKTAMMLNRFESTGTLAPAIPYVTIDTISTEVEGTGTKADPAVDRAEGNEQISRLKKLLNLDAASLTVKLETDTTHLGQNVSGVFLDTDSVRDFYRAYFYSGLYITGLHYLDALSSVQAVEHFNKFLGHPKNGIAKDMEQWYGDLAASKAGQANVSRLRKDIAQLSTLGARPLDRTFEELIKGTSYGDPVMFMAAKNLVARMDDRVPHRNILAGIAYSQLYDLPVAERLYQSSIRASHDAFLIVWYAKFIGDKKALSQMLEMRRLNLEARIRIPGYLKELGATDDEVDKDYQRLIAEAPDNWKILKVYIDFLEATKHYSQARRYAQRWLSHNEHDGFPYIFATTTVAREYYYEGRYENGWQTIEPVVSTQQSGAMERAALLLDKLGRQSQAEALASAVISRYPDSNRSLGVLASIYWQDGKYAKAARVIKGWRYKISGWGWRNYIGSRFVDVFGKNQSDGLAAFSALLAAHVDNFKLQEMIQPVYKAGLHELAFRMSSQLHHAGLANAVFLVRSYQYLKAWRGKDTALAWLRKQIPERALNPVSMIAYSDSEFDLLWDLIQQPEKGEHPEAVWLYRAAAFIQENPKNKEHQRALMDHFNRAANDFYSVLGRYLLGKASMDEVFALVKDNNKRCEAAYYFGLRALSENRLYDASDWFRIAVETGLIRMGEYRWAYNNLLAWVDKDQSLTRIQKNIEFRNGAEAH